VCYGLCLQGLGQSAIQTNLIPREMLVDRMIRAKKPWAAGSIAAMTLGLTISFAGYWQACQTVKETDEVKRVEGDVKAQMAKWTTDKGDYGRKKNDFDQSKKVGTNLVLPRDKMLQWSKLYRAIDACIPREGPADPQKPKDFRLRNEVFITSITSQKRNLAEWYAEATAVPPPAGAAAQGPGNVAPAGPGAGGALGPGGPPAPGGPPRPAANASTTGATPADAPKGTGYVIKITGYHFHNLQPRDLAGQDPVGHLGAEFVREWFIKNLEKAEVPMIGPDLKEVLDKQTQEPVMVPVKNLGIAFPTITTHDLPDFNRKVPNPFHNADAKAEAESDPEQRRLDQLVNPDVVTRYDFKVEFAWIDPPPPPAGGTAASSAAPAGVPVAAPAGKAPNLVAAQGK
jgi:type IV pilus assembly protein PilM